MASSHNGSPHGPFDHGVTNGTEGSNGKPADAVHATDPASSGPGEPIMLPPPSTEAVKLPDFVAYLPEQIWYLTSSGQEMWCRRPYGFFFSTSDAAVAFAATLGSAFELTPIGVNSKELVSSEGVDAMRRLGVHRIFIDPRIDPQSGDVFGRILRIEPMQQ